MGPKTVFCPNVACPARGHPGQGNIRLDSRKDKRFPCTECHKTFTTTTGTAFYRLRTSAETVTLVVTLLAHGSPLHAIVVAFGFDERMVAAWTFLVCAKTPDRAVVHMPTVNCGATCT
jgi:transposase-like protein